MQKQDKQCLAQRVKKLVFGTLTDGQESLKGKQLRPVGVLVYGKVAVAQKVKTLAQQGFMARFVVVIAFALCSFKKVNCI